MRTPKRYVANNGVITWRVRYRLNKQDSSETFDTEKEALQFAKWVDALGARDARRRLLEDARVTDIPTLNQLAADHISHLTGIEDGTRLNYTRLWKRTWGRLVGNIPADEISKDRLADATNELAKTYSAKSLKNQRGLLAAVCQRAVEHGYLTANPTKGLRLPRGKEGDRPDMRILTQDEFVSIVENMNEHYRPLTEFLGATGCRWGEAVALRVEDLNLELGSVRIRRALKWSPDNNRTIGPTKTKKGNRTIVLPPEFVPTLRFVVAEKSPDDLVFTAPKGGPVWHRTFWSDVWHPALEKAKTAPPRPNIHAIRHSHASWLLAAGVPIHIVQARLGHESITTTVDTYGGLMPDAQEAAAKAASLAFVFPRQIGT